MVARLCGQAVWITDWGFNSKVIGGIWTGHICDDVFSFVVQGLGLDSFFARAPGSRIYRMRSRALRLEAWHGLAISILAPTLEMND